MLEMSPSTGDTVLNGLIVALGCVVGCNGLRSAKFDLPGA